MCGLGGKTGLLSGLLVTYSEADFGGFKIQRAFIAVAAKLIGSSALIPNLHRGTCRKLSSKIYFKKVFKELLTGAH